MVFQQARGKSHLQSVEKIVSPVAFEKDKTKDADNIILHDFLQCALNILVSTAFNTLKDILCEVYCLGLYLHELNDSEYTLTEACTLQLPQDTRTARWFNLKASVSGLMISAIVTLICLIYDWNWRWVEAVWRKLVAYHEVCNQHCILCTMKFANITGFNSFSI